ncbi:glycosyltransferase family 58 protein [Collybia nuda]|uniref:Dol-P-Man:Man(5)GlcNAc(2)-PP-Dol alpha-1,3-mannosyltransferase n=1 Tax=Collybia nuda TaxID=64659 RepID=A0A9P5YCR3_9AGAR|nr:glycosyltransferase family 58 protein [Collybia nuda]
MSPSAHGGLSPRHPVEAIRALLTDSKYFWILASLVVFGDGILTELIIRFVPYTEIDWETYMVQTEVYLKGQHNYSMITGPTGPLVYPAGHLRIHEALYGFTNAGRDVALAQHIYAVLYLATLALTFRIYHKAGNLPNLIIFLLPFSKRLHSIYVLRLFNDGWAVFFVHSAILLYQQGFDDTATLLFSVALSIKMSILLYLPGLLVILFQRRGLLSTLRHLATISAVQAMLGMAFLNEDAWAYLRASFDLSRVFLYKWSVNWKFIDERIFLSPIWAKGLLVGHVLVLILFGAFKWCKTEGVWTVLGRGIRRPSLPPGLNPLTADYVATVLFTSNLIGILFARSLHYQFYSWYAMQLPFLAWKTKYYLPVKLLLLLAIEYAFNVFPSTPLSSSILVGANAFLLVGIWFGYPEGKPTVAVNGQKLKMT